MQGEELLIVADPNEIYGENWLLCLTRKAVEMQMEILQQRERERQEALQVQSKDGEDDDDDMTKIVYEDRPVLSKPWISSSARESHEDVESLTVKSNRPLVPLALLFPLHSSALSRPLCHEYRSRSR